MKNLIIDQEPSLEPPRVLIVSDARLKSEITLQEKYEQVVAAPSKRDPLPHENTFMRSVQFHCTDL